MTHLDRYAPALLADSDRVGGAPDDLLTTAELCEWFRRSKQWAEIGRSRGYGPPFLKIGHAVRYRRRDVLAWLAACTMTTTQGNRKPGPGRGHKKQQ